ncbi:hypothetical protein Tco_0309604 [Tanacetum coccineum]
MKTMMLEMFEICRQKQVVQREEEKRIAEEQAAQVSSQYWKPCVYYDDDDDDDDDEENSIPLNLVPQILRSITITPDLPITDSLIMEDEHLNTIPEKESDEVINSSVEELVPIPSESEDLSDNESDNDESFSKEDVPVENFKIYSNPLFEFDEEIISSEINPLYNEVLEDLDSIPLGNDNDHFNTESYLIESLLNRDNLIDSSPKIDSHLDEFAGELALINPIPPGINKVNFDPEGDIRLIKKLLYDNSFSICPPKVLNSEISNAYYPIFLHNLLSAVEIHSKIINDFLNESPMMDFMEDIPILECSVSPISILLDPNQYGERSNCSDSFKHKKALCGCKPNAYPLDCPDFEDSRARGFVHRSLKLQSLAYGNPIS